MATTTAALLLAAIGIVTFDAALFRRSLIFDLSALSRIIADNSTAAIVFDDPRTASETLAALRARPHLVTACIYRADGSILARYARQEATSVCPPPGAQDGSSIQHRNPDPLTRHSAQRTPCRNPGDALRTRRNRGAREDLRRHRAGRAAGFEPDCVPAHVEAARGHRDPDLAPGSRDHVGIGDKRLSDSRAETLGRRTGRAGGSIQ